MTSPSSNGDATADAPDILGGGFPSGTRIALISDIHSNIQALDAVLEAIDTMSPEIDVILCVGDVVGYNANPREATETVRQRASATVMGNHDWAATEGSPARFNAMAVAGVEHTEGELPPDLREWLGDLPLRAQGTADGVTVELVHAAPDAPLEGYVFPPEGPSVLQSEAAERRGSAPHVLVVGHTHVPMGFVDPGPSEEADGPDESSAASGRDAGRIRRADGLDPGRGNAIASSGNSRGEEGVPVSVATLSLEGEAPVALVNPGSVGQPRDGDPRASFAVLDTGDREITWYRVPYDAEAARRAVLEAGLPDRIGDRLLDGK